MHRCIAKTFLISKPCFVKYVFSFIVVLMLRPVPAYTAEWNSVIDYEKPQNTFDEGLAENSGFNPEPISSSETMDARTILDKTPDLRCNWYKEKIQRFISEMNDAAKNENIPARLLATIVLNELADIDLKDVTQDQQLFGTEGNYEAYENWIARPALSWKSIAVQSFGIAQISPKTALEYNAVPIPPALKTRMTRENETELFVAYRLLDRKVSIRAAAKIVKGILQKIEQMQETSAWAKEFIRPQQRFLANDPYAALFPKGEMEKAVVRREREKSLARLVTAVYNSGNILTASPRKVPNSLGNDPKSFPNALKHSQNGGSIAEDLVESTTCDMQLASFQKVSNSGGGSDSAIVAWLNLFGADDKSGRVHAGTIKLFKADKRYKDERFGGTRTTFLKKRPLFPGKTFASVEEARSFLCKEIKNKRFRKILGWGRYPIGDIGGGTYYIDGLGCKMPTN